MVFGPTVGYFFRFNPQRAEIRGSVYPYVQGFANWGSADLVKDNVAVQQYGGKAGLLYMLSSAVAADAVLRIQRDTWEDDETGESLSGTTILIGVGISAFIY